MKKNKLFIQNFLLCFCFSLIFLLNCCVSGNEGDILSQKELETYKLLAVRGNGEASLKVAYHYGFGKNDTVNGQIWYIIGAENGHFESINNLSVSLTYNEDYKESFERGVFWLYKLVTVIDDEHRGLHLRQLEKYGYTLETAKPPSDSMFPNILLTTSDVVRYKEGALKGCGQAALAVANYISKGGDAEEAERWYRIGAQNGNVECMEQYGNILLEKEEMLDQERGKFWLNKAIMSTN